MRDDFLSADWAAEHGRLSSDIHKLIRRIAAGYTRLCARQFSAPWRQAPRHGPKSSLNGGIARR
jgi:hypothetical protein